MPRFGVISGQAEKQVIEVRLTRILLAEDDDDMRGFLSRALEKAGHDVVSFGEGKSAYERLKDEPLEVSM